MTRTKDFENILLRILFFFLSKQISILKKNRFKSILLFAANDSNDYY